MIADGGQAIADLAVLRDQADLFGAVASDPTARRLLSDMDSAVLARLRTARAAARELAWAQRIETRGALPTSTAAGRAIPGIVLDLDASIVICHSDKENASPTWKGTFGYHPLLCFLDATGEAAYRRSLRECRSAASPGRSARGTATAFRRGRGVGRSAAVVRSAGCLPDEIPTFGRGPLCRSRVTSR